MFVNFILYIYFYSSLRCSVNSWVQALANSESIIRRYDGFRKFQGDSNFEDVLFTINRAMPMV